MNKDYKILQCDTYTAEIYIAMKKKTVDALARSMNFF